MNIQTLVMPRIENNDKFSAIGNSKKEAQQKAAKKLINFLKI